MGAAYFYHLTRRPLEVVLPQLLERALGQGWRVLVRGRDPRRMDQIDAVLWTFAEASFLPHGQAGGDRDADQPVLLTAGGDPLADRSCLMCVDGAEITAAEVEEAARVCVLFDGADPVALELARAQWRALAKAGAAARYWSEETGQWEMKAENRASG